MPASVESTMALADEVAEIEELVKQVEKLEIRNEELVREVGRKIGKTLVTEERLKQKEEELKKVEDETALLKIEKKHLEEAAKLQKLFDGIVTEISEELEKALVEAEANLKKDTSTIESPSKIPKKE
eukprot:g20764.t1